MRFNNGGDPIYAIFDKIDQRPLSKIAKDFVKELKDANGKTVQEFEPEVVRQAVSHDTAEEMTSTVYARYKGWCQENGCHPEGMKNFKQGLQTQGRVVRKRPKRGGEKTTMLLGYRLISGFDTQLLA